MSRKPVRRSAPTRVRSSVEWRLEGLRLIGEAQFSLKAYPGARATYEALRQGRSR